MAHQHHHLRVTERRLTRLFMIGIFLFLVIFESIFLLSRFFLEKQNQKEYFLHETNKIIENVDSRRGNIRPSNIGFVALNKDGDIIMSRIAGHDIDDIEDIIEEDFFMSLPSGTIVIYEEMFVRKVWDRTGEKILLFVAPTNYSVDGLIQDMLRFLIMDLIILIPFFFVARLYVRETLEPVRENMDTMTHFVHDAGHELKTPIAIVSGNLQFIRDTNTHNPELITESLRVIDDMNDSIQSLLELADVKLPDKLERVSLYTLIEYECENLSDSYPDMSVSNTVSETASVYGCEKHISMVLRNILENAMKYNTPKGTVTVSYHKNTLTIQDTGIGMAKDDIPRIFDRFYRANAGNGKRGSGIGLTLVERISKLYGWKISVESELQKGTTVHIDFGKNSKKKGV